MGSLVSNLYMERRWEQSLDYLHRKCSWPLVQVCGGHLGHSQNKRSESLHRTYKCCGQKQISSQGEMLEETVCPCWTVQYTLKQTRSFNIDVYRKPSHTDQHSLFDSHPPLELKLEVIRTLNHQAETTPTKTERKEKEQKHIRGALQTCGHTNWTFVKTSKRCRTDREEETRTCDNIIIPYIAGTSKHHTPVHFKPTHWGTNLSILKTKHLKEKNRSFWGQQCKHFSQRRQERPLLNRGGGLWHNLFPPWAHLDLATHIKVNKWP